MHPRILIYLIGHDLLARLRGVLRGSVHAEVISKLDRWSQAVLQAAISFRCDSQLGLSQRLGEDEVQFQQPLLSALCIFPLLP